MPWQEYVSQVGPEPTSFGEQYWTVDYPAWSAKAFPMLERYLSEVLALLQAAGFQTSVPVHLRRDTPQATTGWHALVQGVKQGVGYQRWIKTDTPLQYSPQEFVQRFESEWRWEYQTVTQQGHSLYFGEPIVPVQQPTVQTDTTLQPVQAPPPPSQIGTLPPSSTVDNGNAGGSTGGSTGGSGGAANPPPPNAPAMYTFDQWNYFYRQRTGQVPPAPETVGFPLSRRSEPITYQEWQQYTNPWFAAQGMPPASAVAPGNDGDGGAGGSGGSGGTQGELFTLVAALLALLGWAR